MSKLKNQILNQFYLIIRKCQNFLYTYQTFYNLERKKIWQFKIFIVYLCNNLGVTGIDCDANYSITRSGMVLQPLKSRNKTINDNVELSTWTFDDVMSFIGADYAVAA